MTHDGPSTRPLSLMPALALLGLAVSAGTYAQPPSQPSLAPMIERISPAVVNISVSGSVAVDSPAQDEFFKKFFDFETPPDGRREVEAAGSGVIVDATKGYILTNHHVIENADKITVTLSDNRSLTAKVIGSDKGTDVAVLQVSSADLKSMPLGDSSKLRVGDYVVAIGNPFGFSNTVTSGIVSALGRSGINSQAYEDFIQTDASINPGNSGGALVNLSGELVGINSAILSRSGGNIGIGFAIPVNMVRSIMDQLVTKGSVQRGLLGVRLDDLTPDLAARYGLHDNSGALVNTVTANSAAEKAGIQIDDVIVSVNGTHIRDSGSLKAMIGLLRPGEQVRVGLIRDGREQTVTAVLGELTAAAAAAAAAEEPDQREGFAQLDPTFEGAEILENEQGKGVPGLIVARVVAGSPAFQQGLRQGDVITTINRVPVRTLADAAGAIKGAGSIVLRVRRGNRDQLILMR
ncbi:MAG TPA: Do family serine endopeptidase [Gammaproteobacteria bacterium]|nr:Do family serine endopeptidase [Gammaproteobacteria bacterium]